MIAARRYGSVIEKNWRTGPAPSTSAASYTSLGMLWSAASRTSATNELTFHTARSRSAIVASAGVPSHTIWSGSPRCWSVPLKKPSWSLYMNRQVTAVTTVGIAQGKSMAARTRPRPRNSRWAVSASTKPTTNWPDTDRTV